MVTAHPAGVLLIGSATGKVRRVRGFAVSSLGSEVVQPLLLTWECPEGKGVLDQ